MNEKVNFCSQCGAKISSGVKFCSSCGHDLKNSSTKITLDHKITLDKTIKVEVTNVTVEKGFKTIEKGIKATGRGIKATGKGLLFFLPSRKKIIESIFMVLALGAVISFFILFLVDLVSHIE